MKRLFLLAAVLLTCCACTGTLEIGKTTCDYEESPAIIGSFAPSFGWQLASDKTGDAQKSYQVIVASTKENLQAAKGDCWDSAKTESGESQRIAYKGKQLLPGKEYFWKVRVWDSSGNPSAWSDPQSFYTPLDENMWTGNWIGAITLAESNIPTDRYGEDVWSAEAHEKWSHRPPMVTRSIMLRKEFDTGAGIRSARVYISGLGHYRLWLNGQRISNDEFAPLWSEYDKTVYYNVYDITDQLRGGANAFGVILGNGFYNVAGGRYIKLYGSFGPPTLNLQAEIEYEDGTRQVVCTDRSWKYDLSPVTYNCIFGGENYDATLEQPGWDSPGFDAARWHDAVMQEPPAGKLTAQNVPAVKIMKSYPVAKETNFGPGLWLFDMGQNLSGFPAIKVKGKKGDKIKLVPAEILDENGMATQRNSGGPHYYEYTLKGSGTEEWRPMFTYYGFQYIQVEGADWKENETGSSRPVLLDISSEFIHSSLAETGRFTCSNERFNRIHHIIDAATRSNMQSVFTDCPHREKLGWLEETQLNGPGLLYNYDLTRMTPKIMRDMADSQTKDGLVPDIAPEYVIFKEGFRDSPEWGAAVAINPFNYYMWYGDDTLLREYYPSMKRYCDYLAAMSDDNILSHGLGDWYEYRVRSPKESASTPREITATGHYYYVAKIVAMAAEMTGNTSDAEYYGELTRNIRDSFNKHLFDPGTCQYASGSQGSNAIPLYLGIVEDDKRDAVFDNLLREIAECGYRLTTGEISNRYMYQILVDQGRNDVMYRIHDHDDVPGYGFMVKMGVTTLTESWDPRVGDSWNHFMMGQIEEWFYNTLAGIRHDPSQPGFKYFFLRPEPAGGLTFVDASYESVYGRIVSSWKIGDGKFVYDIEIPVNTVAKVSLPSAKAESLKVIGCNVRDLAPEVVGGKTVMEMAGGKYTLTINI